MQHINWNFIFLRKKKDFIPMRKSTQEQLNAIHSPTTAAENWGTMQDILHLFTFKILLNYGLS
jgi:hypothetical protein